MCGYMNMLHIFIGLNREMKWHIVCSCSQPVTVMQLLPKAIGHDTLMIGFIFGHKWPFAMFLIIVICRLRQFQD